MKTHPNIGDSPDKYKISKQADTCMLFVLMPETELEEILTDLGYEIPDMSQMIAKNIQYYETRTRYIFPSFSLFSL